MVMWHSIIIIEHERRRLNQMTTVENYHRASNRNLCLLPPKQSHTTPIITHIRIRHSLSTFHAVHIFTYSHIHVFTHSRIHIFTYYTLIPVFQCFNQEGHTALFSHGFVLMSPGASFIFSCRCWISGCVKPPPTFPTPTYCVEKWCSDGRRQTDMIICLYVYMFMCLKEGRC